jgi:hypothetical protein
MIGVELELLWTKTESSMWVKASRIMDVAKPEECVGIMSGSECRKIPPMIVMKVEIWCAVRSACREKVIASLKYVWRRTQVKVTAIVELIHMSLSVEQIEVCKENRHLEESRRALQQRATLIRILMKKIWPMLACMVSPKCSCCVSRLVSKCV